MKRKYADHRGWDRILERHFQQVELNSPEFKGTVCYLHLQKVSEPLQVQAGEHSYVIADNQYLWMQHHPEEEAYTLTTMFNEKREIVEMYIDIIKNRGIDERGDLWYDDLYLDLVVLPNRKVFLLDEEECEEALRLGKITDEEFEFAWNVTRSLQQNIEEYIDQWIDWSLKHLS